MSGSQKSHLEKSAVALFPHNTQIAELHNRICSRAGRSDETVSEEVALAGPRQVRRRHDNLYHLLHRTGTPGEWETYHDIAKSANYKPQESWRLPGRDPQESWNSPFPQDEEDEENAHEVHCRTVKEFADYVVDTLEENGQSGLAEELKEAWTRAERGDKEQLKCVVDLIEHIHFRFLNKYFRLTRFVKNPQERYYRALHKLHEFSEAYFTPSDASVLHEYLKHRFDKDGVVRRHR